jgi:hypothetical protein
MTDEVAAILAEETAALERIVSTPEAPFGYGSDLVCFDDMTENADETDPESTESLQQDSYHRVTTERGSVPDDPDFGIHLARYANKPCTRADLRDLESTIVNELEKDERVDSVVATVAQPSLSTLRIVIRVTPLDSKKNAFTLTIAVVNGQSHLEAVS